MNERINVQEKKWGLHRECQKLKIRWQGRSVSFGGAEKDVKDWNSYSLVKGYEHNKMLKDY